MSEARGLAVHPLSAGRCGHSAPLGGLLPLPKLIRPHEVLEVLCLHEVQPFLKCSLSIAIMGEDGELAGCGKVVRRHTGPIAAITGANTHRLVSLVHLEHRP